MKKIIMTENAPKALGPYSQRRNYGWKYIICVDKYHLFQKQ